MPTEEKSQRRNHHNLRRHNNSQRTSHSRRTGHSHRNRHSQRNHLTHRNSSRNSSSAGASSIADESTISNHYVSDLCNFEIEEDDIYACFSCPNDITNKIETKIEDKSSYLLGAHSELVDTENLRLNLIHCLSGIYQCDKFGFMGSLPACQGNSQTWEDEFGTLTQTNGDDLNFAYYIEPPLIASNDYTCIAGRAVFTIYPYAADYNGDFKASKQSDQQFNLCSYPPVCNFDQAPCTKTNFAELYSYVGVYDHLLCRYDIVLNSNNNAFGTEFFHYDGSEQLHLAGFESVDGSPTLTFDSYLGNAFVEYDIVTKISDWDESLIKYDEQILLDIKNDCDDIKLEILMTGNKNPAVTTCLIPTVPCTTPTPQPPTPPTPCCACHQPCRTCHQPCRTCNRPCSRSCNYGYHCC